MKSKVAFKYESLLDKKKNVISSIIVNIANINQQQFFLQTSLPLNLFRTLCWYD